MPKYIYIVNLKGSEYGSASEQIASFPTRKLAEKYIDKKGQINYNGNRVTNLYKDDISKLLFKEEVK